MKPENSTDISQQAEKVVAWLRSIADDRGTMAELRYLLRPSLQQRGWMALASIGGIGNSVKETVAGLFAFYPYRDETKVKSLGESCRFLRTKLTRRGSDKGGSSYPPLDTRVRRLLSADRSELKDLLSKLFAYFKSESIPVNYIELYKDLAYWGEKVRQRWAQDYWQSVEKEEKDVSE